MRSAVGTGVAPGTGTGTGVAVAVGTVVVAGRISFSAVTDLVVSTRVP